MATVVRNTAPEVAVWAAAHNDLKAQVGAGANFHLDAYESPIASANASDLATSLTLVNEMRAVYEFHRGDSLALKALDATALTAPAATSLATAITLANEIKSKYNTHRASATIHFNADATNTVTSADATDQSTLNTLLNEMKGDINAHLASAPASKSLRVVSA
jgi:hypothetical protein